MASSSSSSIPSTMRAWQWTNVHTTLAAALKLNNSVPLPATASSLKDDETLVRIQYSALNPVDYKVPEIPFVGRILAWSKPGIPAMDYCGTVVATKRTDLKAGQLVFGTLEIGKFGALADYAVVKRDGCVPVPDGVQPQDAACVGVAGITAWQCLVQGLPQKDRGSARIFINGGSGGVGTFAIQEAKAQGCYVVATCSTRNVELCKKLGADEVIDYTKGSVVDTLARLAKEGGRFDLALDFVNIGGPNYWQAPRYLKKDAIVVGIAGTPQFSTVLELLKVFTWPSFLGGGQHKFLFLTAQPKPEDYAQIAQLMKEGKVKAQIEEIYDMENAPRAYDRLKTGRVVGKLVVKVT